MGNFPQGWNLANAKVQNQNPKTKFRQSGKFFHQNWKNFHLCRMFQFMWFWNKKCFLENFRSGKFSTKVEKFLHLPTGIQFGRKKCLDAENKISPKWKIFDLCRMFQFMQFCKKNFFCNFLKVENFPPKWKNFHFASLGSNLANAKVQNPKTKFRQSGKFSTKSGKISTSAECSNSCDFGIIFFFF